MWSLAAGEGAAGAVQYCCSDFGPAQVLLVLTRQQLPRFRQTIRGSSYILRVVGSHSSRLTSWLMLRLHSLACSSGSTFLCSSRRILSCVRVPVTELARLDF